MKRISLLILSLLFLSTTFQSDKFLTTGWTLQLLPNLNGKLISGVTFLDSLTGLLITNNDISTDSCYIIKTTNGGSNWNINLRFKGGLSKIHFVDFLTGYASGGTNSGTSKLYKTTNTGDNWFLYNSPEANFFTDMSFANKDIFWLADDDGLIGGLFQTTNGGQTWQRQYYGGGYNPDKIYMVNKNLGFMSTYNKCTGRTTNGGVNWLITPESYTINAISFIDSLTGWKAYGAPSKTTDGGQTWILQILPSVPHVSFNSKSISNFYPFNKDTVFAVGGGFAYGNNLAKGLVYKTTNGGLNWGYQIPDTSFGVLIMSFITFVTEKKGWAYSKGATYISPQRYIFTNSGGDDTTYFVGIKLVPDIVPEKFSLGQNYPNPFNPATNIPFELKEPSHVTLRVFDARGREVIELVNGRWGTGKFIADFDASALATGIYFYQIIISGESTRQTFSATKKMMLLK